MHEHSFNLRLAEALRKVAADWRLDGTVKAEESRGGRRPDIMIDERRRTMRPVIIECAFGGDNDADALARLGQPEFDEVDTMIAVAIPEEFRDMGDERAADALHNRKCPLGYAALQRDGNGHFRFPSEGYCEGNVADLAAFVRSASASSSTIEHAAFQAANLLGQAAGILEKGLGQTDIDEVAGRMRQRTPLDALRTVTLLWLDAMLVQSHLRNCGFEPLTGIRNPTKGADCGVLQLTEAWMAILAENWHSIFRPAVDALKIAGAGSPGSAAAALSRIAEARQIIDETRIGDAFNVGGELFPKVSADRKTAAAFYTTPPTAEFLAGLTIRPGDNHKWSDPDLFRSLRIADLACGTGTLLRAAYRRVRNLGEANGWGSADVAAAHVDAMEGGLTAADVSPIAAHLANSGLALAGSGQPYSQTRIGWVEAGKLEEREHSTGSLEFLTGDSIQDALGGKRASAAVTGGGQAGEIQVEDAGMDYVIMNPPYSRTRGGQAAFDIAGMNDTDRKACQDRWKRLLRQSGCGGDADLRAGMAASFLCLARLKTKPGGRIGFVLPLTAAFAGSWGKTRAMICREFEDVVAVTRGKQRLDEAYSADTGMGEMLLVATRRSLSDVSGSAPVACATLCRSPTRQGEAGEFARAVLAELSAMRGDVRPVRAGGEELGQIVMFRPEGGDPWSPLGSLEDDISLKAVRLGSDGILGGTKFCCRMTRIGELFEMGPTHDLIGHPAGGDGRGAYRWTPLSRQGSTASIQSLWAADSRSQQTIACMPTHRGELWEQEIADRVSGTRGRLHYSRGMRWTSQSVLAAATARPVFGGRAWTTLLHDDVRVCSAFALWANSSLGMMVHWTRASRTQEGRAGLQVNAIGLVQCPDFGALPTSALELADKWFNKLSQLQLRPACQAHRDRNRHEIDRAVLDLLGADPGPGADAVSRLRLAWCREPSVHGRNKAALAALESVED